MSIDAWQESMPAVGLTTCRLWAAKSILTNDSGPMHLAAGLGTPVVGVFTCTDPYRSGPPESCHQFITSKVSCAGSYHKRCPYVDEKKLACFDEIDVERVWNSFRNCMQQNFAVPYAA